MKTPSAIKTASALFASAILLSQLGHAQIRTFNVSRTFSSPNFATSAFGASATLGASDSFALPTPTAPGAYTVTGTGTVTGRALSRNFTAAQGTGSVRVRTNGNPTFFGNLRVAGITVLDVRDPRNLGSVQLPRVVKEVSATASIPIAIPVLPVPINISTKVKSSVSARFVATATVTPTNLGLPQIALSVGPEASAAATAEASVGVGIDGVAAVRAGASGRLTLVSVALKANSTLTPVQRPSGNVGMNLNAAVVASFGGLSGGLDIFAEADVFLLGTHRVSKTIASFNTGVQNFTLASTGTRQLF
jgi:hypothetical protein